MALSITGQHRDTQDIQPCAHPFTPKGNLERPINLKVMIFWTVGGSWRTWREPMHAQGEHANIMQKDPGPGVEPMTVLLQGNSATNHATVHSTSRSLNKNNALVCH
ncbi:hypothetical protein XENORESO_013298 [Xenotaenia resolanae]|uniref:Uncharacterized protein n=1 Tax=Xenotaenia resolanae TaxID=208358 RepID=A0ABV0W8P3_9TELE